MTSAGFGLAGLQALILQHGDWLLPLCILLLAFIYMGAMIVAVGRESRALHQLEQGALSVRWVEAGDSRLVAWAFGALAMAFSVGMLDAGVIRINFPRMFMEGYFLVGLCALCWWRCSWLSLNLRRRLTGSDSILPPPDWLDQLWRGAVAVMIVVGSWFAQQPQAGLGFMVVMILLTTRVSVLLPFRVGSGSKAGPEQLDVLAHTPLEGAWHRMAKLVGYGQPPLKISRRVLPPPAKRTVPIWDSWRSRLIWIDGFGGRMGAELLQLLDPDAILAAVALWMGRTRGASIRRALAASKPFAWMHRALVAMENQGEGGQILKGLAGAAFLFLILGTIHVPGQWLVPGVAGGEGVLMGGILLALLAAVILWMSHSRRGVHHSFELWRQVARTDSAPKDQAAAEDFLVCVGAYRAARYGIRRPGATAACLLGDPGVRRFVTDFGLNPNRVAKRIETEASRVMKETDEARLTLDIREEPPGSAGTKQTG